MDGLPSIMFWGSCLRAGKKIKVAVPEDVTLHITKASLDGDATPGRNVVLCKHGDDKPSDTAICVLSVDGTECFDLAGLTVTYVASSRAHCARAHTSPGLPADCHQR
jgi:hypothetical protein